MTNSGTPSLLIWMNMPSHHQSAFFQALRDIGINLKVCYYSELSDKRRALGWEEMKTLPQGEMFFDPEVSSLNSIAGWRHSLHIIPGYGERFLRQLVSTLSRANIPWMHWSEAARPGLRWWASFPIKSWYARMVNKHAVAALAIGEMARKDFLDWGIRDEKITFLPYAVRGLCHNGERDDEVSEFGRRFKVLFVYVGELCYRKGIDLLLKAFAHIVRSNPSMGLVLVGKDSGDSNYRELAAREKLIDNVLFRGPIKASCIASVLGVGGVLVLPSRFDGWGMVINEAASVGMALIATDACGSAHHLIRDGENGFKVPAGSISALEERMMLYCQAPELIQQHGLRSLEIFREFTPERNAQRLLEILDRARQTVARQEGLHQCE